MGGSKKPLLALYLKGLYILIKELRCSPSQDSSLLFLLVHSSIHNLVIEKSHALDQVLGTEAEREEIDKIPSSLKLSSTTKVKTCSCVWGLNVSM